MKFCIAVVALALSPSLARAAHPLITEDTGLQGRGRWQLEVDAERPRDRTDGVTTRGFQPSATLTYGAADSVDLQLTVPYLRQKTDGAVVSGWA